MMFTNFTIKKKKGKLSIIFLNFRVWQSEK